MFKKILVLIEGSIDTQFVKKTLEIAEVFSSQIIAFNVVDLHLIRQMSTHLDKREAEIIVDLEENGWKYLYFIEDLAKDRGVKIILIQEEGILESNLLKAVDKYKVDLVVMSKKYHTPSQISSKFIERILHRINCPLLII